MQVLTFVAARLDIPARFTASQVKDSPKSWQVVSRRFASMGTMSSDSKLPAAVARKLYEVLAITAMQFEGCLFDVEESAVCLFLHLGVMCSSLSECPCVLADTGECSLPYPTCLITSACTPLPPPPLSLSLSFSLSRARMRARVCVCVCVCVCVHVRVRFHVCVFSPLRHKSLLCYGLVSLVHAEWVSAA
jgi:hypothetical protein